VSLIEALQYVAWAIAAFGVIIIVVGSTAAFLQLSRAYLDRRIDDMHRRLSVIKIRAGMTSRVIFGLDFLIASDIIISTIVPSVEDILRLGGIVVIRTVLTYIISKETQELERREMLEKDHGHESSLP